MQEQYLTTQIGILSETLKNLQTSVNALSPPDEEDSLTFTTLLDTTNTLNSFSLNRGGDTISLVGPATVEKELTFTTLLDTTNTLNSFSLNRGGDTISLVGPATVEKPLTFETAPASGATPTLSRLGNTVTFTPAADSGGLPSSYTHDGDITINGGSSDPTSTPTTLFKIQQNSQDYLTYKTRKPDSFSYDGSCLQIYNPNFSSRGGRLGLGVPFQSANNATPSVNTTMVDAGENEFNIDVNPAWAGTGWKDDGYLAMTSNCLAWIFSINRRRSYRDRHDGPITPYPYTDNYPYFMKPYFQFVSYVYSGRPINQSTGELPATNRAWRPECSMWFGERGPRLTDQVVPGVTSTASYNDGAGNPDPPQDLCKNRITFFGVYNKDLSVAPLGSTPSFVLSAPRMHCSVGFTNASDDRLKWRETPITNALATLDRVNPVKYLKACKISETEPPLASMSWETGFIAQEIMAIPELAHTVSGGDSVIEPRDENNVWRKDEDGNDEPTYTQTGHYELSYNCVFTHMVAALKELHAEVKVLRQRVDNLQM